MDGSGSSPLEKHEQRSLLPALIFAWLALYLGIWLGIGWNACTQDIDPDFVLKVHAFTLGCLALLFLHAFATARRAPAAQREPEAWLCQHCLKPYVPGAHFCPRCGAPKTFYSGVPDYERAYAQAWILGKAAHHPSRPMHIVVLSVIAIGEVLTLAAWTWMWLRDHDINRTWAAIELGALSLWLVQAYIFGALFVIGWRAWRRRAREEPPVRPEIEYGAPPWFSCDAEWALPEYEEEPDGDEPEATPAAG